MAWAACAVRTINTTTAQGCLELWANANYTFRVMEVGMSSYGGVVSVFLFGKPAAIGVLPRPDNTFNYVFEDMGNIATPWTTNITGWITSAPTAPTTPIRRGLISANIGASLVWDFPRAVTCLKNTSLAVTNSGTTTQCDMWTVIDE